MLTQNCLKKDTLEVHALKDSYANSHSFAISKSLAKSENNINMVLRCQ